MNDIVNETVNEEEVLVETETQAESTENAENAGALVAGVMHEQDIQKVSNKQKVMKILVQVGLYLFLGIMAFIIVFPFYWMLISSVKSLPEY
ncbi:MAG: hypothetical protein IKB20_03930, partial [Clostridia bacterium]|nr:hypothetical protein [Clostridia bacterium]